MSGTKALVCNVIVGGSEDCNTIVGWCNKLVSTLCVLLLELVLGEEEYSVV